MYHYFAVGTPYLTEPLDEGIYLPFSSYSNLPEVISLLARKYCIANKLQYLYYLEA